VIGAELVFNNLNSIYGVKNMKFSLTLIELRASSLKLSTFQKAVSMEILLLFFLFTTYALGAFSFSEEFDHYPFPSNFLFGTASSAYQVSLPSSSSSSCLSP
jgi:hypothetical protein